ncbi:MAG: argininosuccinate lyase [Nitrospinota bacterium]
MARRKPWAGRFGEPTHDLVEQFTQSVSFDRRLALHDIRGSAAHAKMLAKCGILRRAEAERILRGLRALEEEVREGRFPFDPALEDVHMNVEARLIEKVGPAGGKLHTARSRNDQVALDLRLYLREEVDGIRSRLRAMRRALLLQAEAHLRTIMPGYTHLQRAQPVSFAHHLLAYGAMFRRDGERFGEARRRINVLPLGSGALAGTGFAIDRAFVARELGFEAVSENSMDAVSDRDFAVEFAAAAALTMAHLSRLAEDIALWASAEFAFVDLPDAFCTGSSLMPQKKNPDVAELVRAKAGRVFGDLVALLTVLKGLPLAYNRDLQEDKEALFDAADTLKASLEVMAALVAALKARPERMAEAAREGFLGATDLADYLAGRGVPFREAHRVVGRVVRDCLRRGKRLEELTLPELRRHSRLFDEEALRVVETGRALERRRSAGGPSPSSVRRQIARERRRLDAEG